MKETVNCIIKILNNSTKRHHFHCLLYCPLIIMKSREGVLLQSGLWHQPLARIEATTRQEKKRKKLKMTNTKMTELEMITKRIKNLKKHKSNFQETTEELVHLIF